MRKRVPLILLAALVSLECTKSAATAEHDSSKSAQVTFERKRQCMELGWIAYQRDVQDSVEMARKLGINSSSKIWGAPRYYFNSASDTCYVEHEDTDSGSNRRGPYILFSGTMIDVLTNDGIAAYSVFNYTKEQAEQTTSEMTRPQFEAKRKQLMGF